jgi:hypothetical protein
VYGEEAAMRRVLGLLRDDLFLLEKGDALEVIGEGAKLVRIGGCIVKPASIKRRPIVGVAQLG